MLALRVVETGAAEEIELRLRELLTYLIIFIAVGHVRVESARCCMVDSYRGHDTDAPALCLQFLGNRGQLSRVLIETQHPVAGLGASRETCTGCCRVGDAVGLGVRGGTTGIREGGHERLYASERFALKGRTVHLGEEDLVGTHAVADEIEDVLNFRVCDERYYEQHRQKDSFFHYLLVFYYVFCVCGLRGVSRADVPRVLRA